MKAQTTQTQSIILKQACPLLTAFCVCVLLRAQMLLMKAEPQNTVKKMKKDRSLPLFNQVTLALRIEEHFLPAASNNNLNITPFL